MVTQGALSYTSLVHEVRPSPGMETSMWQGWEDGRKLEARDPMDGDSLSLLALLLSYRVDEGL